MDFRISFIEARYILALIEKEIGTGYAEDPQVSRLQAKLSMLLELGSRCGDPLGPTIEVRK